MTPATPEGSTSSSRTTAPPHPSGQPLPRRLILRNHQSPGDIVMLTAAVRDLHRTFPGQFLTDVRTSCGALWENNPHITALRDDDPAAELIECQYPLIHKSNQYPYHFIHGFIEDLSTRLGQRILPGPFKGSIFLAPQEKHWMSQVQEITHEPVPFWIIVAGGKADYTIKWWDSVRWQQVVDHFRGKILFAQVGEAMHWHPPLKGVLDLRGKTDLRQLVRLVYHAQGVLCPVTMLMHLAAAVEVKGGRPLNRPCVVVAGGREPSQWEAYPHHQFIHMNGALFCCDNGGCWKSRTIPLGDGDEKDNNLCIDVVPETAPGPRSLPLPRCMDMITSEEVIRRIELYFAGGTARYLDANEARIAERVVDS
jgi:ADP-heptose:LPS heptosyltransferase